MTPLGLARLQADEACRLTVYDDGTGARIVAGSKIVGNPTVGWGRNLASGGLRQEEADMMLANDLQAIQDALSADWTWFTPLDPVRQDVLMNMAYNLGVAGVLSFVAMAVNLGVGAYGMAADEVMNSEAARELPARYQRLADAMRTGAWS